MPDDSHQLDAKGIATGAGRRRRHSSKIEWMSFSNLPFDEPSWLIDGLIPAKSLIMLYGARGQGKTFVALDIAASIASGLPCLGRKVANPGQVGYLLAERPEGLKRRLSGWLEHRGEKPAKLNNIFVAGSGAIKLDDRTDCDRLINSIRDELIDRASNSERPPLRLLVIDPLAAHMGGSENDATDMAKFTNALLELSKALDCSVLIIHHEGKGNFNNRFGARGSSALEAALDTVLYMCPDETRPNHAEIRMTKQREFEETPSLWLEFIPKIGQVPDKTKEPIPLGKLPSLASPPPKVDGTARKGKIDDEIRAEISSFIRQRAPNQGDNAGVTIDEVHAHIAHWVTGGAKLAKKPLSKPIIRAHVDYLKNARQIVHINPDCRPYRYRLAD